MPRLVCAQGLIDATTGATPVYRHPSDQALPLLRFSPMVAAIRETVVRLVGHDVNHVLIQLYRGGEDFISEHADKTLDVVRGSRIVNVSLGARRTMRLRMKRAAAGSGGGGGRDEGTGAPPRKTQLVPLPHGSVFVLGLKTNEAWLHGINADKRLPRDKTDEEMAFDGQRISLTFRHIGTFLSADEQLIWGQGACGKTREAAGEVVNGDAERNKKLVMAFGMENQMAVFDRQAWYGRGFDVLHFEKKEAKQLPLLFLSGEKEVDAEVRRVLEEAGLDVVIVGVLDGSAGEDYRPGVCLRDVDVCKTQVVGLENIKHYVRERVSF